MALYQAAFLGFLLIGNNALTFDPTQSSNVFVDGSGANVANMMNAGVSWILDVGDTRTTVTVTLPVDQWFGIGFGIDTGMAGAHALLLNTAEIGPGTVQERDFGGYEPGTPTASTWIVDNFEDNGLTITYVVSRDNSAGGLYTFDSAATSVPFLAAMGVSGTVLQYHSRDRRIYGMLNVAADTTAPTAMPTQSPLAPGQTQAPTTAAETTDEPGDNSKGVMKGTMVILPFVMGFMSIMAIL